MTISLSPQRVLRALLLGSLGLLAMELLRPVDVHAATCTLDPLGGEVCLPDDIPDDPKDSDDPPEVVIAPPASGPAPSSRQLLPTASSLRNRPTNRNPSPYRHRSPS